MNGIGALNYFNRLGKRERVGIVLLAVTLFLSIGYRIFWQPSRYEHKKIKSELQKTLDQIQVIKSKFPDIESEKGENAELREDIEDAVREISTYETRIPSVDSVSQLLGEITRRSEGLNMDFESIRQNMQREKEGYLKLQLDVKFTSPYASIVNYLRRLESLSDYLTVEDITVTQTKEGAPQAKTALELSMLLVEKGIDLTVGKETQAPLPLAIQRDPFVSKRMDKGKGKEFKLSGITWAGKGSTAIINDEVVRVGTQIGEWKITQILPDAVVLSDGSETASVTLGR